MEGYACACYPASNNSSVCCDYHYPSINADSGMQSAGLAKRDSWFDKKYARDPSHEPPDPKSIYRFVSSFVLNLITSFSAGTFSINLLTSSSPSILENFIASLTSGKIALALITALITLPTVSPPPPGVPAPMLA